MTPPAALCGRITFGSLRPSQSRSGFSSGAPLLGDGAGAPEMSNTVSEKLLASFSGSRTTNPPGFLLALPSRKQIVHKPQIYMKKETIKWRYQRAGRQKGETREARLEILKLL